METPCTTHSRMQCWSCAEAARIRALADLRAPDWAYWDTARFLRLFATFGAP
jgi:hypothetical protein